MQVSYQVVGAETSREHARMLTPWKVFIVGGSAVIAAAGGTGLFG